MSSSMNISYTLSAIDKITPQLKAIDKMAKSVSKHLQNMGKVGIDTKGAQGALSKLAKTNLKVQGVASMNTNSAQGAISKLAGDGFKVHGVASIDTSQAEQAIESLNNKVISPKMGGGAGGAMMSGAGGLSMGGMAGLAGKLPAVIGTAVVVDQATDAFVAFKNLEKQQMFLSKALNVDFKSAGLEEYKKSLKALSLDTGRSREELTALAIDFAKVDSSLSGEELAKMTRIAVSGAAELDMSAEAVAKTMQAVKATFGKDTQGVEDSINMIGMLADNLGVLNEQYLLDFMRQNGALLKSLGANEKQILSFAAATGEAQLQAGEAGNMLKNLALEIDGIDSESLKEMGIDRKAFDALSRPDKMTAFLTGLNLVMNKAGVTKEMLDSLDEEGRKNLFLSKGADFNADAAFIATNVIGKNYNDAAIRAAASLDKKNMADAWLADESTYKGRAEVGLSLESETASGRLDRFMNKIKIFKEEVGQALYEAFAGDEIMPIWNAIGDDISKIMAMFRSGADESSGALTVLKTILGGIGVAISVISTVLTTVFHLVGAVVDTAIGGFSFMANLLTGDVNGAFTAVSVTVDSLYQRIMAVWDSIKGLFSSAYEFGSKIFGGKAESPTAGVKQDTAQVMNKAGVAVGAPANVATVATAQAQANKPVSPDVLATNETAKMNTAKQVQSVAQLEATAKIMNQASMQFLQAAQTPLTVQPITINQVALGDQGRPA